MSDVNGWVSRQVARLLVVWGTREIWMSFILMVALVGLDPWLRRDGPPRARWSHGTTTDLLYTLFYLGGVHSILVSAYTNRGLAFLVGNYAPFLRQDLLSFLPAAVWFLVLLVVMDFFGYWAHRCLHRSPLLWLFHAVHHSQEQLNAFTTFRFHVGDIFFRLLFQYVPFTLLGSPAVHGVPLLWMTIPLQILHESLAHCDLPWTLGPFGRLMISPAFHRLHHSTEARHRDANFGLVFSVWDALFGTADWSDERPSSYGTPTLPVPESFVRQIAFPFLAIVRGVRAPAEPAAAERGLP